VSPGPELSIVVPTFREHDNIEPLVREIEKALEGVAWEVIFVDDDSPDATSLEARRLAQTDHRVRCLQRIGRRGLSSACIEGLLSSSAPYLAVMDGDLQHDPSVLLTMLDVLRQEDAELVIGSRYIEGGSIRDWASGRVAASRLATRLSRLVLPRDITDPMSGFFMLRQGLLTEVVRKLSGIGFKLLLDIVASADRRLRYREVPIQFRLRQRGESKLDSQVAWEYLMLLADKLVGPYVPIRFLSFTLIGAVGVGVHLIVLTLVYKVGGVTFVTGQTIATLVAMVSNFALNNLITYRDRRVVGWRWFQGLASFVAACSVGAIANIGVAAFLFSHESKWVVAALAGVLTGAVWNYAVTSVYTWGQRRPA
jgi:dolichol-phosphate mannosyltransferase